MAVYLNALDNPFAYDDHVTVLTNPSLVDLRNWCFVLVFSPFRPIVNVSYAIDRALWGFRPFGFHLTNLILHAINVVLLFRFVRLAVLDCEREATGAPRARAAYLAAFGAAVLLAVHPLMTEAVGYISGRSEVLCGTFFLLALLLMRTGVVRGGARWLLAGFIAFLLALASKETAVMLPFVFASYDYLCLTSSAEDRRRRLWRLHAPLMALVAVAAAVRLVMLLRAERQIADGLWPTILTQITVVPRYLGLLLVPLGQSIVHPVRQIGSPVDPWMLLAAASIAGILIVAWRLRRVVPLVAFGLLWFFLVLVPSSSVVALRESMAEHRVYLASCGLFIAAGAALARSVGLDRAVRGRAVRRWVAVAFLVAILGSLTVQRNRVWASPITLWAEAAGRAPMYWEPHYSLGDALREQQRCAEAIEEYRIVIELRPDHRDALNNLGICLADTGQLTAARETFERVLTVDPGFARAETNLGGLALLEQNPARARQHFERARRTTRSPPPRQRALEAHPSLGIVGPLILSRAHPSRVASCGMVYSPATGRVRHLEAGQELAKCARPPAVDVDGVSGCVMVVRREVFERVGLFSEEYFFSFEDLDFCLRARADGFGSACITEALAYHEGGATIGHRSTARVYFATRNHLLLAARTGGSSPALARTAAILGLNGTARRRSSSRSARRSNA